MKKAAMMLVLAVALAGCTSLSTGEEKKPDVITIEGPTCTVGGEPCSGTEVTKYGGPAKVKLVFHNYGEKPVNIEVGENGRNVMVSKCNNELASIQGGSFEVRKEGPGTSKKVQASNYRDGVKLEGDQKMTLLWTLEVVHDDSTQISRLGYTCPMEFEFKFQQEIKSSQQIQVKKNGDVADVTNLDFVTSSKKPVKLLVDSPQSFVKRDGNSLTFKGYIKNVGNGEITDVKSISPTVDNLLKSGSLTKQECPEVELRMYGRGRRAGESYRRICNVPSGKIESPSPSRIAWLRFTAKYRYQLPAGSASLQIGPTGG